MDTSYRIVDEPKPSPLSKWAVNPFWPFLALMLGGAGVGFAWFAFNAFAMGSATRVREWLLVGAAFVGSALLAGLGMFLMLRGVLDTESIAYAGTLLIIYKLAIGYFLHFSQARSFELFEYFGGTPKNGLIALIALSLTRGTLHQALGSSPWIFVLG